LASYASSASTGSPYGQVSDTAPLQKFEVVSVKSTHGQPINSGFRRAAGGVLNATNVSVRFLIEYAYDVRDDQISGGPAWLDVELPTMHGHQPASTLVALALGVI
jgi:hypothetical protein